MCWRGQTGSFDRREGERSEDSLAFPVEINDAFAKADRELEVSEKVESEKPIDAALWRQVVAQHVQVGNPLADRSRRAHGGAWSILDTASHYDALSVEFRISWVISKLRHDLRSYDRQTRASVEHNRDNK